MFSIYRNLQKTVKAFVGSSKAGYSVSELKHILKIEVKEPLLILYRKKQVYRKRISGCYMYSSTELQTKKNQLLNRSDQESDTPLLADYPISELLPNKVKKSIWLFFSILNEKQRRLYAGLESLKMGYGGDKKTASLLGIDPHTVAKGRSELLAESIDIEKVRKKGAGRILTEKKAQKS